MLSPKTQYNLKNAKSYFAEHLSVGDYYTQGERLVGQWIGKGAAKLGLRKEVQQAEFLRLCDNYHPGTGELLTQRRKTTRMELNAKDELHEVANRRVFYDFTISPPKSVSILALVMEDERIVDAHSRAIVTAMKEMEAYAATRIRIGGQSSDRITGNVIGAVFQHETSRALDPHLHSHCILFNATFDEVENRWKALQNSEMLKAQKYVEAVYYHELAKDLQRFGYEIDNHRRGDFQIRGVPQELCDRFSKRHQEIDEKTRALLEREPAKGAGNIEKIRENIAHKERAAKNKEIDTTALHVLWREQISPAEHRQLRTLTQQSPCPSPLSASAEQAIDWAESHLFERRSVIHERDLWKTAIERVRGTDISIDDLKQATQRRNYIRYSYAPGKLTTAETLDRELQIVLQAREGINQHSALAMGREAISSGLDEGQRNAIEHILSSCDAVTLFRGGAGTGKSYTLRSIERQLRSEGHGVHILAPQRQQVADLLKDGFTHPKTLAEFLGAPSLNRGDVVILDEAGQVGAKQMQQLFDCIKASGARVILSGDTRQHGAVEASDALWAIERHSGLSAAVLEEIRRQDPFKARNSAERKFIESYKMAVDDAAKGDVEASFQRLDELGAILECPQGEQQQWLTAHYLEHVRKGEMPLVVAQTWTEIHSLNNAIRSGMKVQGLIKPTERVVSTLERVDLTDAQKQDARYYSPSSVVVFNRSFGGFQKGTTARLQSITPVGLFVEQDGKEMLLSNRFLRNITVCEEKLLQLSSGDRLQLKANAKTADGKRLANGELVTVRSVRKNGSICLADGRIIPASYRQFTRGYAVTSYASQGKTVDHILFSDSGVRAATNAQQWYVSISRGRKGIQIFTSDKEQLRENVGQLGTRTLALDLIEPDAPNDFTQYQSTKKLHPAEEHAAGIRRRAAAWEKLRSLKASQSRHTYAQTQSI